MITVVSGLPRSGTSLMMQMLAAGGLEPLTDGIRAPNPDNPRGYYEWEPIKQLPSTPELIAQAEGKVVKVISSLLHSLPMNREYRVIFLRRPLDQVVASQEQMVRRQTGSPPKLPPAAMQAALEAHLRSVTAWLSARSSIRVHSVDFPRLIEQPLDDVAAIASFLECALDEKAMLRQVDAALHRNR